MAKVLLSLVGFVLLLLLYNIVGIVISYTRQPTINEKSAEAFNAGDFYSDFPSPDKVSIIDDNEEALFERLRMINQAKERIILSTFEFRADESGKDILAFLLAAAKRGVEIKIISDGSTASLGMDKNCYFEALSEMETVDIRIYNRISFLKPWKSMGRLHDKYLIVDDYVYILGGRNTYDFFLGDNGYKNHDRDVLVYTSSPKSEDSSIHQVENYFDSVWNLKESRPLSRGGSRKKIIAAGVELEERYKKIRDRSPEVFEYCDYEKITLKTNKVTLLSNPTHVFAKEPTVFYKLAELMKRTDGDIYIHTPYIICNKWMYDSFREVCARGQDTYLLTNSPANNANLFGASDYIRNKRRLIDTGLKIFEYEGGISYHCKSLTLGNRVAVVGSLNMDMRSVYLDTELMLVIDSEEVTEQLRGYMRKYEADSVTVLNYNDFEIPDGVSRQTLTAGKKLKLSLLNLLQGLRFLF